MRVGQNVRCVELQSIEYRKLFVSIYAEARLGSLKVPFTRTSARLRKRCRSFSLGEPQLLHRLRDVCRRSAEGWNANSQSDIARDRANPDAALERVHPAGRLACAPAALQDRAFLKSQVATGSGAANVCGVSATRPSGLNSITWQRRTLRRRRRS